MKAVVWNKYGPPEVLQLKELPKPKPKKNEVLIRIYAATINTGDCEIRRFQIIIIFWLFLRIITGIFKPRKNSILGQEVAGVIEAVGDQVTQFKPGDKVMGVTGFVFGGYAEYVSLPVKYAISHKPKNFTWEQAAALPIGGANALHFLRKAKIQAGQKVLIYGSSGSIGTVAVQLAKYYGAEVFAVCSEEKFAMVKRIGADHTISYRTQNFADFAPFDVIFDTIGKSPFLNCVHVLHKHGIYLHANPRMSEIFRALWISATSSKKIMIQFASHTIEDLNFLKELAEAGHITTVIDNHRFTLDQAVHAHEYVEHGHKFGNVVFTMSHI